MYSIEVFIMKAEGLELRLERGKHRNQYKNKLPYLPNPKIGPTWLPFNLTSSQFKN